MAITGMENYTGARSKEIYKAGEKLKHLLLNTRNLISSVEKTCDLLSSIM
jgi:hypothetical protein